MQDDYIDYDESEPEHPNPPDAYFLQASNDIQKLYNENRQAVFYMRQLQVKFEKKYYHWITRNAIVGLNKLGILKQLTFYIDVSGNRLKLHFFHHKTNRYPRRKATELAKIVSEYSESHITRSCGNTAEILFVEALSTRGFTAYDKNTNNYKEKKWKKTAHNLDYIFEKDGVAYGCEIKNTLSYIDKEELEVKLKICKHLKLKPLFIMRTSPTNYNKMIIDAGGFALIFEAQIYDLSQTNLVERIKDKLGYIVDCPRAIPAGIIDRFEKWHNRNR